VSTFTGRQTRGARRIHRELRREQSQQRQEVRRGLSNNQQVKVLDHRLGMDTGAARERARLS
jgi:hypothetical protein